MPSFVYHTVLRIYVPSLSLPYYPFLRLTLIDCLWLRGQKCILLTPLSVTKESSFWLLIETQLAQIQRQRHVIILGPWSVGTTTPLISKAGR